VRWIESAYAADAALFARERLGFEADPVQRRVLDIGIRRGILNCRRQWGKSTVTAIKAVHRAYHDPGCLVLVVSPSGRQSGEFVRKCGGFLRRLGVRPRGDGDNEISLALPNGSRLVGLPGNEATARGFTAPAMVIIDEASRVPDELYLAMRPMLTSGDGDLWLMATPWGKRGFFYEVWAGGDPIWTRVAVPATEDRRMRPEALEEERAAMGDAWFRQEYLCEFVQADDAVFREEDVYACLRDDVPPLYPDGRP
jgi:hypothetical protein